ncbi:MAG TPA: Rne/Rng family ribonuclease [Polyangiaceae bacterium]|nr:Rne/Rng family ribonuclease [Polyangiaceae bacterium]
MAKNLLVINVDLRETRVALIEEGIIAELHVERASTRSTLGNIVLGKVSRVLPGMQAAFIDIGQERAAFLHVEDLIRPDDFEAYLTGGKRPEEDDSSAEEPAEVDGRPPNAVAVATRSSADPIQEAPSSTQVVVATALEVTHPDEDVIDDGEAAEGADSEETVHAGAEAEDADADHDGEDADADHDGDEDEDDESAEGDAEDEDAEDDVLALDGVGEHDDLELEADEVVELAVSPLTEGFSGNASPDAAVAAAPAVATAGFATAAGEHAIVERPAAEPTERGRSGGDSRRREEKGRPGGQRAAGDREPTDGRTFRSKRSARMRNGSKKSGRGRDGKQQGRGGGRNTQRDASRLSRSTPIREVVREGQEVIVQVSKEPIGTKGARVTSHISLPGRYVVYMPTLDQIGISKRIGSDKERARLREAIESLKPPSGGLIVRTVAEGLTKKQLKADVGYLVRLWEDVAKKRDAGGRAPAQLYQELDLVLKTARDLFTDDIAQIVIDDKEQYHRLLRFVEMFMPERAKDIVLYSGDEPIFDAYGIEDEIGRALSRKVPLPSGGHLIIDQAEALTAIDVNTGRYVGKGSKDLEDTLFKTNLEAVEEIAYQLRFRNLGGLIVLDLIDMDRASNREKVRRRLEDLLQKDKAKTTLNRISDLGLIEMTRKRTRESLGRLLHEPCFYCDGTGQLQSKQTVAYEILRQIRRDRGNLPGYSIVVNAHPAVIDLMKGDEREAVQEAERRFMRRIDLVARREYHLEQFDLLGK